MTEDRDTRLNGKRVCRNQSRRRRVRRTMLFYRTVTLLAVVGLAGLVITHFAHRSDDVVDGGHTNEDIFQPAADQESGQGDLAERLQDQETVECLHELVLQDQRVQTIIDNHQSYPIDLLKMLAKNLDMLDFVLDYPEKQGQVTADTIGDVEPGTVPLLLQYDQRWGYGAYGSSTVVVSGCGPTCLAMVIAGLTGENTVTPYDVAQYADEQGFYVAGAGTAWMLMSESSGHFGVIGKELPLMKSTMERNLNEGHPIICSMRPGDFTTSGHYIVITGIENGQFTVNDPNSTQRSNMLWSYETLEPQISNLWAFQAV